MKKLSLIIPLFCSIIVLSCNFNSSPTTKTATVDSIPPGAIPFEYDFKLKKAILIQGTLNDSIPLRYMLETGSGAMVFSDNLACDNEIVKMKNKERNKRVNKPMTVQIGNWKQTYGDSIDAYYLEADNRLFEWLGPNVALIHWDFFDKKIIEISFTNTYIRELADTKSLFGYNPPINIIVEQNMLKIPVVVEVQGKKIDEFVAFDTGNNGDIFYNNDIIYKYDIKQDSAYFGSSRGKEGLHSGFSIPVDSIKIGKSYVVKNDHYAAFSLRKQNRLPFSGIIGNNFFENFDMVLDLKNYNLYLKPVGR